MVNFEFQKNGCHLIAFVESFKMTPNTIKFLLKNRKYSEIVRKLVNDNKQPEVFGNDSKCSKMTINDRK